MLRRALFCVFWFGVFWIALLIIGGGLAGVHLAGTAPTEDVSVQPGFQRDYQAGVVEGVRFRERYGTWVLAGAAGLALAGTFTQILPGTKR